LLAAGSLGIGGGGKSRICFFILVLLKTTQFFD